MQRPAGSPLAPSIDSHPTQGQAFRRALSALLVVLLAAPPAALGAQEDPAPAIETVTAEDPPPEPGEDPPASEGGPRLLESDAVDRRRLPHETPAGSPLPVTMTGVALAAAPGGTKSASTPQAMSLPGTGSIGGMGESFTPELASGAATFSIPLGLAPGRAGVTPNLTLAYASTAGNGALGIGWAIGTPFIARQSDRGLPRYVDRDAWHAEEDRFFFNGGQELVPVDDAAVELADCGSPGCAPVPTELAGWPQYRARVEGAFMRFFRAPDSRRWVVQLTDGTRHEFGVLAAADGPPELVAASVSALESEQPLGGGRIHRWLLTRTTDPHGSPVHYRYLEDQGQRYLLDIHYTSPHGACGALPDADERRRCAAPLAAYGHRVRFVYEARPDVLDSYTSGWRIRTARRLRRVESTAAEGAPGERSLVRRYHLGYDPGSYLSMLATVQAEGRPTRIDPLSGAVVGRADLAESALGDAIVGQTLPPVRLRYTGQPISFTAVPGFGGIDGTVHAATSSPPDSVGADADLFDVNSDGLPDLLVSDPARFHTEGGEPAVGVFFNGFRGAATTPATAGEVFSAPVAVAMDPQLASVMRLSSANVVPMDGDGDGRSDLLHMPRQASYGTFTPVRTGAADAVTPAQQGWRFAYLDEHLPPGDLDPRIDLAHDGAHIKVFDVNNDHLVDVVRTTGDRIQTWLNLGWLPGGDGRFGSYRWQPESASWQLSTAPLEACLPVAGTPVDFADPEVHLGDMNGDGLQDIVRVRANRVIYWPGTGEGPFGHGSPQCAAGLVTGRFIEMATPPASIGGEPGAVHIADVNADGVDDVVQVRYSAVDVWLNRAGASFTTRLTVSGTPWAPAFDPRVRLVDLDGSGTLDVVYASADQWRWVDLMGGRRPRLLEQVDNGLGGLTQVRYGSSAEDYLLDLAEAASCTGPACERFTWSSPGGGCDARVLAESGTCGARSGGSPLVTHVVRQVEVSDQFQLLGLEENRITTRFRYHDGYYEGIEQEFRGFGAADTIRVGSSSHPGGTDRAHMHQGRRAGPLASDRLAHNPDEALKGAPWLTERLDDAGRYLSSKYSMQALRTHVVGRNGVPVVHAHASQTDTLHYDTGPFVPGTATLVLPWITRGAEIETRVLRVRGARWAHVRSTVDELDGLGRPLRATDHGRLKGQDDEPLPDERIVAETRYTNLGAGGWMWRVAERWTHGHGDATPLAHTTLAYTAAGDVRRERVAVTQAQRPDFPGEGDAEGLGAPAPEPIVGTSAFDAWGNLLVACVGGDATTTEGCLRLSTVSPDPDYALVAESQTVAVRRTAAGLESFSSTAAWDRGLGLQRTLVDWNGATVSTDYDGLGRPTVTREPGIGGCADDLPTSRTTYHDAQPGSWPVARVHGVRFLSCTDATQIQEVVQYVDGLERARATLTTGDDGATGRWLKSGVVRHDARGQVQRAWQSGTFTGDPDDAPAVLRAPLVPSVHQRYDGFDRPVARTAEDGSESLSVYHALAVDTWDALDLQPGGAFEGTYVTSRSDGHGRAVDEVLRNRQPGSPATEIVRLYSRYRADGALVRLERAQTANDAPWGQTSVVAGRSAARTFVHDSIGRRVAASDPNTDDPASGATWRYLFSRAGDLAAVRDPRGCGQNFYHDLLGRLIGEAYVGCAEAQPHEQPVDSVPAGSVGWTELDGPRAVDRRIYHDGYEGSWAPAPQGLEDFPAHAAPLRGRTSASVDRARRAVFAYDARGNAIWEARQVAVIPATTTPPALLADPPAPQPGQGTAGLPVVYDEAHTYVRSDLYDYGGRSVAVVLPRDPDLGGASPRIAARLGYGRRGLPVSLAALIVTGGGVPSFTDAGLAFGAGAAVDTRTIVAATEYTRDGLAARTVLGDDLGGARAPTETAIEYDARRRPSLVRVVRAPTGVALGTEPPLAAVSVAHAQAFHWDAADNLVAIDDLRVPDEWPAGFLPQWQTVQHDALYRVVGVEYDYAHADGSRSPADLVSDWRDAAAATRGVDPMRPAPPAALSASPEGRVASLTWQYDWLGNMSHWGDDAHAFFERSLGTLVSGSDLGPGHRPSALYLAADLEGPAADRGGWVEVRYGAGGNVVAVDAHARCVDRAAAQVCQDPGGALAARAATLRAACACDREVHYQYDWDELNRLAEVRRYERSGAAGAYALAIGERYRYDGSGTRFVKESRQLVDGEASERVALYPYPSAFERRGLIGAGDRYDALVDGSESQYLIDQARVVWKPGSGVAGPDPDHRITYAIGDLLGSTSAVIDLRSGALVEVSTRLPTGAHETLLVDDEHPFPLEPIGFAGQEEDLDTLLVYHGARYLIAPLARWASPDPAAIHELGGGEALNVFHYVSGNLLQARDPLGLEPSPTKYGSLDLDQQYWEEDLLADDERMKAGEEPENHSIADDGWEILYNNKEVPYISHQDHLVGTTVGEGEYKYSILLGRGHERKLLHAYGGTGLAPPPREKGTLEKLTGAVWDGAGWVLDKCSWVHKGCTVGSAAHKAISGDYEGAIIDIGLETIGKWDDVGSAGKAAARAKKRLPRYQGKKPKYHVNEAHVKGSPLFNPKKSVLPRDAEKVYKKAVPDDPKDAKHWYGVNDKGVIYRFSNANDGTAHYSGNSEDADKIRGVTDYALRRLGVK